LLGIQTLEGHSNNVCSVLFHPRLPVLVSASEDGTVRIWHATTYRAETTLNYGLERAWSIAAAKESNGLAIGYDEGTILIKLGHDAPVASLDTSFPRLRGDKTWKPRFCVCRHTGKLVWAHNNDIQSASLKGLALDSIDGQTLIQLKAEIQCIATLL
jgi:coatomer subunit beta'